MKKYILVILFVLVMLVSQAQSKDVVWLPANQKVVSWDTVTKDSAGATLPVGAVVSYRVYTKTEPAGVITEIGTVSPTTYTITFTQEGRYWVGVRAERIVGGVLVAQSPINWSSDTVLNTDPFGISYYATPGSPGNIR